jgi:hypothetical protein
MQKSGKTISNAPSSDALFCVKTTPSLSLRHCRKKNEGRLAHKMTLFAKIGAERARKVAHQICKGGAYLTDEQSNLRNSCVSRSFSAISLPNYCSIFG